MSKLDQENLRLKIEAWQRDSLGSSHYFRPYIKKNKEETHSFKQHHTKESECISGVFVGSTGSEDDWLKFKGTSEECTQTLLWVHQTDWQKELFVKYGNTITLIDATYKTTKYDLALFFYMCTDQCQLYGCGRIYCTVRIHQLNS